MLKRLLPCFSAVAIGLTTLTAQNNWLPEIPEIPVDARITADQLDNGLRFVHARHVDTSNSVSIRLIIQTGANDENEDELGYAHFVEHMAFNGTTNFPAETLGATLAKAGIRFGPEVNAFTTPDHTVFQLDLSHHDPETIELALRVMRDWCDGLVFDSGQVKRERKVVLAEMAARGIVAGAFTQERMGFVYPDHPLGDRFVGGTPRSVDRAKDSGLKAFYQRWYRPDNAILTVVGDFEPAQISAQIKQHFASFRATGPAPTRRSRPLAANPTKPRLHWTQIGPIKSFNFEIVHTRPEPAIDSNHRRIQQLTTQVVLAIIQTRLNRKILLAPSEVETIAISLNNPSIDVAELSFGISGKPEHWKKLLDDLIREHQRVLRFGILPAELEETREIMLKRVAYARRQPNAERAPDYAQRLTDAIIHGRVMPALPDAFSFVESVLPSLTVADCEAAMADFLQTGRPRYFIYGDLEAAGKSQNLVASLQATMSEEIEPPAMPAPAEFPYNNFGAVGRIASQQHDAISDVHQVKFTNGVRLNFKQTDFKAESVSVLVRLRPGGLLRASPAQTALPDIASRSLISGGLNALDIEGLTRSLNGRFAELSFRVDEDSLVFNGVSDREQITLLCSMIAAYLSDPALAPSAVSYAVTQVAEEARLSTIIPEPTLRANFLYVLSGKDDRFRPAKLQQVTTINEADVRAWLLPQLETLPLEFSMIGDILLEDAVDAVAQTMGALPVRSPIAAPPAINWQIEDDEENVSSYSPDGRGGLTLMWPVKLTSGVRSHRELELLAKGLNLLVRERLREEKGLAYSPQVGVWYPDSDPTIGYIRAEVVTERRYTERADREIRKVALDLAKEGFSDVLLTQAINPTLDDLDDQMRDNDYWLYSVLDRLSEDPDQLRFASSREADLRSITTADLTALARTIFKRNTEIQIFAGLGTR